MGGIALIGVFRILVRNLQKEPKGNVNPSVNSLLILSTIPFHHLIQDEWYYGRVVHAQVGGQGVARTTRRFLRN